MRRTGADASAEGGRTSALSRRYACAATRPEYDRPACGAMTARQRARAAPPSAASIQLSSWRPSSSSFDVYH